MKRPSTSNNIGKVKTIIETFKAMDSGLSTPSAI